MNAYLRILFLLAALGAGTTAQAQTPPPDRVAVLRTDLHESQRAHLRRVLVWGGLNAVLGSGLLILSDREREAGRFSFGLQSAAWGTINVGIAVVGLLSSGDASGFDAATLAEALGAENGYADILLFNLGLNVAYAAVGGTLIAASYRGVGRPEAWRGHGAALVVQGLGLFVLDGLAYFGSRGRSQALLNLVDGLAVVPHLGGATLSFSW